MLLRVAPYDSLPSAPANVTTVSPRGGAGTLCALQYSATAWVGHLASDYCALHAPASPGRRLSATSDSSASSSNLRLPLPDGEVTPEVLRWSNTSTGTGNWYRVRLPGTQMVNAVILTACARYQLCTPAHCNLLLVRGRRLLAYC